MHVIDHTSLPRVRDLGRTRFAAASGLLGAKQLEIWIEMLEPHARAELVPLERERIVLVQAGYGTVQLDGAPQRFHAPCSLMLPSGTEAVVINIGAETMHLVVAFMARPATETFGPSQIG